MKKGDNLEALIEYVNKIYDSRGEARIDKIATPTKLTGHGKSVGWYDAKSTVDYTGCLKGGRFIAFDAKQTKRTNLPAANIKAHQLQYLKQVNDLGGIGFLLIEMIHYQKYFVVIVKDYLLKMYEARQGLNIQWLEDNGIEVDFSDYVIPLDYLNVLPIISTIKF